MKLKLLLKFLLALTLVFTMACKEENVPLPDNGPNPDYDRINQDIPVDKPPVDRPDPHCTNTNQGGPLGDLLGDVDDVMCSKKCEKNYTALKKVDEIDPYGHLAFSNSGWSRYRRGSHGRCRGMTIRQQQFNMLAEFGKGPNPHNCGKGKPMTEDCKSFYKNLIKDVHNYKVAEIPGFRGLHEFSRDPYIQSVMREELSHWSYKYNVQSPTIATRSGNSTVDQWNEVMRRMDKRQLPYLGIRAARSGFKRPLGDHAVMPYKKAKIDGKEVMCIRDPNIQPAGQGGRDACQNYMYLSGTSVHFKRKGQSAFRLDKFNIWREDETRSSKYVKARYEYCIKKKREGAECV